MKQWIIIGGTLIVLLAVIILAQLNNNAPTVTDFASCAAAGNPIMESYPEQCHHDGVTYTNMDQQAPTPPPTD